MASEVNMTQACLSADYARRVIQDYYTENKMHATAEQIGQLESQYKSYLPNWYSAIGHIAEDDNQYSISDDDFDKAVNDGKKYAEDATGYHKSSAGEITRGVADGILAVGSQIGSQFSIGKINSSLKKIKDNGFKFSKDKNEEPTSKEVSLLAACALNAAQGTYYLVKKPNKEQYNVVQEFQNDLLPEAQNQMEETTANMETAAEELAELTDEAAETNEDANSEIEDQKTDYDFYKQNYESLKAKAESGEALTEEEKELYQECIKYMTEIGDNIQTVQEETTDTVECIYGDIETYQEEVYDISAENIANVQGITEEAASIDKTAQTMCYIEGGAQTLNAASGAANGAKAVSIGTANALWGWGGIYLLAGGAAIYGGTVSGIGATEQFGMAGDIGNEIDLRKMTQDINAQVADIYDTEVDNYMGQMETIADLELVVPDNIEAPEDESLPETNGQTVTTDSNSLLAENEEEEPPTLLS